MYSIIKASLWFWSEIGPMIWLDNNNFGTMRITSDHLLLSYPLVKIFSPNPSRIYAYFVDDQIESYAYDKFILFMILVWPNSVSSPTLSEADHSHRFT